MTAVTTGPARPDPERLGALCAEARSRLVRVARGALMDKSLAEDAVQEACARAFSYWQGQGPAPREDILSDLLRRVRWRAGELNRDLRRHRRIAEAARWHQQAFVPAPAEQRIDRLALRAALAGLSAAERQLLALRYGAGLTWEEVGHRTGSSWQHAARRGARSVERLRRELAGARRGPR